MSKGKIEDPQTHQMQPEWVNYKAELMQNSDTRQYTPGNAEIGAEIQRVGVENVRRLVVAIDPKTLEIKVYEGQADRTWKEIGSWDGINLEQPHWGAQ